ncbi:MAG: adenylate/guanylate cyclase domain-containing protein [Gammaproteobacteria bacterium]|nr:MAG: adenylate/guanylate cyclase domain-containing protein [Gammaproteobacteria bacterium]
MSPRTTKKLIACLGVAVATAALGAGYSVVSGGLPRFGALAGLLVGLLVAAFELFFVQTPAGAWLRRLPLIVFVVIATLIWALLIGFSIYVATPYLLDIDLFPRVLHSRDISALAFAFGLAFLLTFFLRVESLIGGRVLFNFLIGRYHKPTREQRVFMFLDIADSTRLSEQFGDVKIQALIGRFFFDIARPIADHGGETYRYIGDEVVVSWPMAKAVEHARCLRCVFDVQDLLDERREEYRRLFGVVPRFRVGMHGGPVVIGEVGDSRRAIVYFGETVSRAVALQGACKRFGHDFLVSAGLMEKLRIGNEFHRRFLGPLELFPDGTTVDAYALSRERHGESWEGAR